MYLVIVDIDVKISVRRTFIHVEKSFDWFCTCIGRYDGQWVSLEQRPYQPQKATLSDCGARPHLWGAR